MIRSHPLPLLIAVAVVGTLLLILQWLLSGRLAERANVILISIDTLRPDHLGCYGYEPPTSPAIDRFCADSVVFETAIAHSPSTLPSHASILTSVIPQHHGASKKNNMAVGAGAVTLAEALQEEGYATVSFNGGGQLDRVFGLDQGFDLYESMPRDDFGKTVAAAVAWLDDQSRSPFFMFLHTYEVHHPYEPPRWRLKQIQRRPYSGNLPRWRIPIPLLRKINMGEIEIGRRDLEHIIDTYDAEIHSMDDRFGDLIQALRERDLYRDSLIIFTSDHGEEFSEHGRVGWHSHSLYEELLRIPLIIKLPDLAAAGKRVDNLVRGIDIAPTILDLLDLKVPVGFEGESVLGLVDGGEVAPRVAVSSLDHERSISSLRTQKWKLYRGRLYDLESDPQEQTDVSAMNPRQAELMRGELQRQLTAGEEIPARPVQPDAQAIKRLRALGYLGD